MLRGLRTYRPRPPQVDRSTTTGHQSGPRDARACGHGGCRHHAAMVLTEGLLLSRRSVPRSAKRVLRMRGEHIPYPGLTRGCLVWRGVDDDRLVPGRGMEVSEQAATGLSPVLSPATQQVWDTGSKVDGIDGIAAHHASGTVALTINSAGTRSPWNSSATVGGPAIGFQRISRRRTMRSRSTASWAQGNTSRTQVRTYSSRLAGCPEPLSPRRRTGATRSSPVVSRL